MELRYAVGTMTVVMRSLACITIDIATRYQTHYVYLLHPSYDPGDVLNTYKYFLNEINAKIYMKTLIKSMEDMARIPHTPFQHLHVIYTSDIDTHGLLMKISTSSKLSNRRWLVFLDSETTVKDFFADIHLPMDCEFLVAQRCLDEDVEFSITGVYHVHPTGALQMYALGNWSSGRGLTWIDIPMHHRRRDLQGIILKGAFIPDAPYVISRNISGRKPYDLSGFSLVFWNLLQELANFTLEYHIPEDNSYGSDEGNVSWSGILGMVIKKEVDVGINVFQLASHRMTAVGFLPPIFNSKVYVYIRQTDPTKKSLIRMLSPFSTGLWGAILVTISLLLLTQRAIFNIGVHFELQEETDCQLLDAWLYILGIFCQQGHRTIRLSWSSRLVYLTAYFIALVLLVTYSATFISSLAVSRQDLPFSTFEDILKDGTLKVGVRGKSSHEDYFKKSSNPILKSVYEKMIKPNTETQPKSFEEGLQRVCKESKVGFVVAQATFRGLMQNVPCTIVEVPKAYYTTTVSFIINGESPYKRLFAGLIQDMRRSGILRRIDTNFWTPKLEETLLEPPKGVTFETVMAYFVLLASGILICILILVVEMGCRKR
ncbi:probable glutamate receptor [Cryptotermes secundus]|uniref:probable glutamate receptor n=1 Tax=Cryptotermes secundus TaxID=105785 RepID=UPI001454C277|nr:probable glutamate receptor [Cryptotermes secundus]